MPPSPPSIARRSSPARPASSWSRPARTRCCAASAAITEAGYPYVVAELDGRVAGYAYVNAYRTRPAYRFTVENSVYIAPDAQGKGIGRALLDRLIATCRDDGFRLMIAVIGDSANFASISLHRRAGFRFCGTIHSVGYKFGRWLDSVIMELPLGEGDTSGSDRKAVVQ